MFDFFKPILIDFQNPVLYAIPIFALLMGIEIYVNYKDRSDNYSLPDTAASLSMGIGSVVVDLLTKSVAYLAFWALYEQFGFFKGYLEFTALGWLLLFFFDDFTFYWHHRLSHQVRLLWAAHVNHHSSTHYNLSTALRQSWTEVFYKYIWYLWLPILGFHPIMILVQMSLSLIYQFWIHTKHIKQLPTFVEYIFNTPAHHRVHHAKNILYLDKNHAGILIIWDRLFGTFQQEDPNEPVEYGITTNINTYNPLRIASHDFVILYQDLRKANPWSVRLKYLLYPPGWSPDGSTQTADQMRATWQKEQESSTKIAP